MVLRIGIHATQFFAPWNPWSEVKTDSEKRSNLSPPFIWCSILSTTHLVLYRLQNDQFGNNHPAWVAQSVERVTLTISLPSSSDQDSLQDHLKVAGSSPASGSIPESLTWECSSFASWRGWWELFSQLTERTGRNAENLSTEAYYQAEHLPL